MESQLGSKLVELNHYLDGLFRAKEVMMKVKPKGATTEDTEIDECGYKDLPTVGVSITYIKYEILKFKLNQGVL